MKKIFIFVFIALCTSCFQYFNGYDEKLKYNHNFVSIDDCNSDQYYQDIGDCAKQKKNIFLSSSPLKQFLIIRNGILQKDPNYKQYIEWFSLNEGEILDETLSFMVLADLSNENYFIACVYYVYTFWLNPNAQGRTDSVVMAMNVMRQNASVETNLHLLRILDGDIDSNLFLALVYGGFFNRPVEKDDGSDFARMHQRTYAHLLWHFYGVEVPFPERQGMD